MRKIKLLLLALAITGGIAAQSDIHLLDSLNTDLVDKQFYNKWENFDDMPNTFIADGEKRFLQGWHVEIFNRNHVLIYEGTEGWDGTYKNQGKPLSQDTYFYRITDKTENGEKKDIIGYITLFIRKR